VTCASSNPQFASFMKAAINAASLVFLLALLLASGAPDVRAQSALDGFDPNPNGTVNVVVVQPDGKILIGGAFTTLSPNGGAAIARNRIARLNPDGSLDTAFNPDASNTVWSIAVQADGKILAGGDFTSVGGATRNRIARLDPVTGLADPFDPNANSTVRSIAVQTDGKILLGGVFTSVGGATRNCIARLDSVSGLADSFDANANNTVLAIVTEPGGKILVGGAFTSIGGKTRNNIARLDASTASADSFDPNASSAVFAIAIQADSKILLGGAFVSIGGQTRNGLARLDSATGLADSFNPNPDLGVFAIAVQTDGRVLAGGDFTSIGGKNRGRIARLDPITGEADSFDPTASGSATVFTLAVQGDGKVLAGGNFSTLAPNGGAAMTRNGIARLEIDGRLDQTLDLRIVGNFVETSALQPDGKIIIAGFFSSVLGVARNNIARLNADGTLDSAFDPNANDDILSIAVQADGKILVGGIFTSIGGQTRNRIARLDAVTGAPDSFDPNATGGFGPDVASMVVQANGKILVGGTFTSIGGAKRNNIARLDGTTGLADSFDPNANSFVFSIAVQGDGKILVGGDFSTIGGAPRTYIGRLDPTTGLADSFNPNPNERVRSLALQADGKILVGGFFNGPNSIGGATRNRIARLDPATGMADSFDPNANNTVFSIAVQEDGKVLAGGGFHGANSIGGATRNYIARLDPATGAADSFDPKGDFTVFSVAVQADGKILAGGVFFGGIGGQSRYKFARLSNDTAALQNLAVTQTSIVWARSGACPQLARVTFESSTDNLTYTPVGNGIPQTGGSIWTLTGLNLPTGQNIYIRARGYYRGGEFSGSESITESVRNAFLTPGVVANVSTRLPVGTDGNVLIEGFIVKGPAGSSKKILVRALGPSLAAFGIGDAVANPTLDIFDENNVKVATNNDWRNTQVAGLITADQSAEIASSGLAPGSDLESVIIANLTPGNFTAVVRGLGNTIGTGVVDAFDVGAASPAKLANFATRGLIQPGDKLMIAGFTVQNDPVRAVVRAIGPSLLGFGIANALQDTTLELRNQNGAIVRANDDWETDQKQELESIGLQPGNAKEAALIETIPPGQFTAQVRGNTDATGVGVVEVYFLQ
jgi:uncharacterized delta-60 repeat protein